MKTVLNSIKAKIAACILVLLAFQGSLLAQDVKAEIKGEEVGSWFSQNWLWVAGVVLLLLIILLASSSSRRSRVTTTSTGPSGRVNRTTTTEEVED
jgi:heme/copper-type cytochrome/quinol oxidase subunit 2